MKPKTSSPWMATDSTNSSKIIFGNMGEINSFIESMKFKFKNHNIWMFYAVTSNQSYRGDPPIGVEKCRKAANWMFGASNSRYDMRVWITCFGSSTGHPVAGPIFPQVHVFPSPFIVAGSYQPVLSIKTKKVKSHCSR